MGRQLLRLPMIEVISMGSFVEFRPPQDFVEAVVGLGDEHSGFHAVGQAPEMPAACNERPRVPKP
jgi:hypothetical protein